MKRLRLPTIAILGACALLAGGAPSRGDLIRLKNGGEIRGKVDGPAHSAGQTEVTITTLTGARVTVRSEDIEFVTPRSLAREQYETRVRQTPDTIDAHWELAEWCREQRLTSERAGHLERILELDPNHEAAHRGLGHSLHNGRWTTRDEVMRSRGYIKHKGRYVTQQELDLMEKTREEREAEQQWYPKVRLWFGWATGRNLERREEGARNLLSIGDPDAVPALESFLADVEDAQARLAFVRILGGLSGPKPVRPLVARALEDPVPEIRTLAVEVMDPDQQEAAVEMMLSALEHEENVVICRAGEALGLIGGPEVVPPLIEALVTNHRYKVQVRDPGITVTSGGFVPPGGPLSETLPQDVEAGLRTGQLTAVVVNPPIMRRTKTVLVKRDERNREVLSALKKLTGKDFGYDERSWKLWWAALQSQGGTLPADG